MKKKATKGILTLLIAVIFAGSLALAFTACEGPEGPLGATGEQGPVGPEGPGADSTLVRSLEVTTTNDAITVKFDRPLTTEALISFYVILYKSGSDPLGSDSIFMEEILLNYDTDYVDNRYTCTFEGLANPMYTYNYIIIVYGNYMPEPNSSWTLHGSQTRVNVSL